MPDTKRPDPEEPDHAPLQAGGALPIPSAEALDALVYQELKRMAHHHLRSRDSHATLSTTELVHEAYFKLAGPGNRGWERRAHFFGAASRAMRQVIVDFARKRQAAKRGSAQAPVSLSDAHGALEVDLDQILALDDALKKLNAADERLREIVELRFFAGLPEPTIAELLGVSTRTVERQWLKARLFLMHELGERE